MMSLYILLSQKKLIGHEMNLPTEMLSNASIHSI
jgi:hypothetical protein